MKKIITLLLFSVCLLPAMAQSPSWKSIVQEFMVGFDEEAEEIEDEFAEMGIEVKVQSGYNPVGNEIILEVRFLNEMIYNIFDTNAINESKRSMLMEYKDSYRSDTDFAYFIKEMKKNNSKFKISYSYEKNGKVSAKSFTITPAEIMN